MREKLNYHCLVGGEGRGGRESREKLNHNNFVTSVNNDKHIQQPLVRLF
jgi:hypothetical protein